MVLEKIFYYIDPFSNVGKVWSGSEIWDLIEIDDLHPPSLIITNCSEIPQVLISPVELLLCSTFLLFINLFVTFPLGSPLLIGENHTEMAFGRKELWNPVQWTKYSHLFFLVTIFPYFLNKHFNLPACGACLALTRNRLLTKGRTFDLSTSRSCGVLR